MRIRGRWLAIGVSAVAAFVLCAFIADRADAETKIAVGIVSHGTSQWPQYVAAEFGWFKTAGLSLDIVSVGNGTAQQLAAGAIDVAHSGFPEFIRATNQGAHVKIVINDISVPPYTVYAKPAIKTIAALRGKIISIGGIKDVTLIYMRPLLASAGLAATERRFRLCQGIRRPLCGAGGRCRRRGNSQSALVVSCCRPGLCPAWRGRDLYPRIPVHRVGRQYGLDGEEQSGAARLHQDLR